MKDYFTDWPTEMIAYYDSKAISHVKNKKKTGNPQGIKKRITELETKKKKRKENQGMKATVVSSHFSTCIDNEFIDLFYYFDQSLMQVYINGNHYKTVNVKGYRIVLSYINIVDISVKMLEGYRLLEKKTEGDNEKI